MARKQYHVYLMASQSGTLYTGVTSGLKQRVYQHKQRVASGFTNRYNVTKLVYAEVTNDVLAAIQREKQIKGWVRKKKLALIASTNPEWRDLSDGWFS